MIPKVGDSAPDVEMLNDEGKKVKLSDFRGKRVVLYFYPKDFTSGCELQACSFRDAYPQLEAKNAVVLGVSPDDVKSHKKFKEKFKLNFPLLADTDKKIVQSYDVWKEKSMYGRTFLGIIRTTVLVGTDGRVAKVWRHVKVDGHADQVLEAARTL